MVPAGTYCGTKWYQIKSIRSSGSGAWRRPTEWGPSTSRRFGALHWTSTRVASPQSSGERLLFHPEVTMTHNSYEMEGQDGRVSAVLNQLPAEIAPSQLTTLDQFHAGGAESVERLLSLGGVGPGQIVVDLGSGLGGPARLAPTLGAKVIGVDRTAAFVALA